MNPRDHAEKATLGAILNDPRHLRHLSEWLDPEDFYTPQHADLYRAMLILDERDATPDLTDTHTPQDRAQAITAYTMKLVEHLTAAGTRIDAAYLHTLMQSCPRADHAPYYARMVVEADTHRVIIENATRLAQLAHEHHDEDGPELLFLHTAAFRQVITNLADRWGLTPADLTDTTAAHRAQQADDRAAQGRGRFADQLAPDLDAPPTPDQRATAAEHEDTLLACIMRSPHQLDRLRTYLEPDDFTAPGRAACYQAALDLHDRGDPIDPVTLAWETRKHANPTTPASAEPAGNELGATESDAEGEQSTAITPLTGDDLLRLYGDGLPAEVAPYHARHIVEIAIHTATTQAARDLKTLASNPSLGPADVLPAAAQRLDHLTTHETRWRAIHTPEPPPEEAAEAAQRAPGQSC